jgi:hypothetical protein
MAHDNRSKGNRIEDVFVYQYLFRKEDGRISGAGFYRVDINPDAAVGFGAIAFESWEDFRAHSGEKETPTLFIIENDNTSPNAYGL